MADNNTEFNGFLIKPVTSSMLFDAVADATSAQKTSKIANEKTINKLSLKDLRILVVEDNPMNQQIAQELLTAEGATVDLAINGQFGIEKVSNAHPPYDVVLMDLQMPDMDGFTATRAIRKLPQMKALPIIAMTANVMSSDKAACLEAGMNDHIGKPIDLDTLVNTILFYCGKPTSEAFRKKKKHNLTTARSQTDSAINVDTDSVIIDLDTALQRIGGNQRLFIRLITLFKHDTASITDHFKNYLSNNNFHAAADLMHTLKSLAATVGATQLTRFSTVTEKTLRNNPASINDFSVQMSVTKQLEHLLEESIKTLNAISDKLLVSQPATLQTSPQPDNDALLELFNRLDDMLETGNMRATRIFSTLKEQYGLALSDNLNLLEEALNQLDFKRALECSQALRKELQ